MNRKPVGCFTLSGFLAMLLTLAALALVAFGRGNRMFSPGPLNAQAGTAPLGGVLSHAELAERCEACHTAPWAVDDMADRCLDCHSTVVDEPQDFHNIMLAEGAVSGCRGCHTDHRGADALLTVYDLQDFPHNTMGFSLQAHERWPDGTSFRCSDCHPQGVSQFDSGLCESCHADLDAGLMSAHLADFGQGCLDCHDGVDRYTGDFDHAATGFMLEGAHQLLDCAGCHRGARSVVDLQSASTDCFSCHAGDDAHNGEFGQDCETCHTPVNWEEASFDHARSNFPLVGEHQTVECKACHLTPSGPRYAGTPMDCYSCHREDDPHGGEFGQDCQACHTPEGWEQVTFDHSQTTFPLTGAHIRVECSACHQENRFAGTPQQCAACHAEPTFHLGLFPPECESCHTTQAWSPARFDDPHQFPINHGEGGPSECRVCHPDTLQAYTCYGCHEHNPDRIAAKHREEGISDFTDCMRCHPTGQEDEGEGGGEGGDD